MTGTNGKTTTSRMIAHIMKGLGRQVGMTSTDGIVIDERLVIKADASGPALGADGAAEPARRLRRHGGGARRHPARGAGLRPQRRRGRHQRRARPPRACAGIDTLEQLADVKAVVVEAVPRDGFAVLNADDPHVRTDAAAVLGSASSGSRLAEPGSEVRDFVDDYCRRGGRAVVLDRTERGDMIVIRHGRAVMQLAWTHLLPATFGGTARFNVANAMAAAGAAFASGAALHDIRQGLRTFATTYYLSPGRLNLINVDNVDVFVDYCHNAAGMTRARRVRRALRRPEGGAARPRQDLADRHDRAAGDRRDDDMRELGARRRRALRRPRRP